MGDLPKNKPPMADKPNIKILNLASKKVQDVDVSDWIDHLISGVQLILSQSMNTEVESEIVDSESKLKENAKSVVIIVTGSDSKVSDKLLEKPNASLVQLEPREILSGKKISSFEFFVDGESGSQPMDPTGAGLIGKNYWLKLVDLAFEVTKGFSKDSSEKKKNIFLASVNPTNRSIRDELKRDLQRKGYEVFPLGTLPKDAKNLEKEVSSLLKDCELSIHIIGKEYGKELDGGSDSITDFQNQVAAKYCQKNPGKLKRVVWQSPDDIVKDQRQREYIDSLVKTPELLAGAEFLKIPIEHLKSLMVDLLEGRAINENVIKVKHDQESPDPIQAGSTYLINDILDQKWADEIVKDLSKGSEKISSSQFLSSVSKSMAYHKECLALCGSVILLADKASPQWVAAKMKDILKSPGFGREKDFSSKSFVGSKNHADLADKAKKEGYKVIDKGPGTEIKALKETVKSKA